MRFGRGFAALFGALALAWAGGALAQGASCDRLRADLAALDAALASGRMQGAAENVRRQRAELERTTAYARSIGCQRQGFLFFGAPRPAECGPLESQMAQMQANLAALEGQAQRGGLEAQRASLAAAYNAGCSGAQGARGPARRPGLFEELFGVEQESSELPEELPPVALPQDFGDGAYRTLCVRKCDGYYFPISASAPRGRFETDSALCQASCPGAEAELFVHPVGQQMESAQSLTGEYYSSLPNAFRYRKSFDVACFCRRPGQSWAESLAEADKLVASRPGDIVVTEQKSLEMSRPPEPPKAAPAPPPKAPAAKAPPPKTPPKAAPKQAAGQPPAR